MFPLPYWFVVILILFCSILLDLIVIVNSKKKNYLELSIIFILFWLLSFFLVSKFIYLHRGFDSYLEFYLTSAIEISLSLDNILVFVAIFNFMSINDRHQHKILFLGIISAIIFRILITYKFIFPE